MDKLTISAMPHRNGNLPEHFCKAADDLYAAAQKLQDALRAVSADVLHGRNYQHLPMQDAHAERSNDLARFGPVADGADLAIRLAVLINHNSQE